MEGTKRTCKDCGRQFPRTREFFGSTPSGGFRRQCRACMREHVRNYDNATPERRAAASERAMRRRDTTFSVSERQLYHWKLIRRDGPNCYYCGTELTYNFHIDHKTPINKGGSHHDIDNLALACMQCNQEKYNKDVDEYREWRRKNRLDVRF